MWKYGYRKIQYVTKKLYQEKYKTKFSIITYYFNNWINKYNNFNYEKVFNITYNNYNNNWINSTVISPSYNKDYFVFKW